MLTRHLEVETKLTVRAQEKLPDPLRHKAVRRAGLVQAAPVVVHELDATYFDTDDLDLLRSEVTLRRRTGGEDAGWHVKLPADAKSRSAARTEVRAPLGDQHSVPVELADLVRGTARGRELKPVARLQNHRTVHRLLDRSGTPAVEVADDAVTATRFRGQDPAPDTWREVEVELLAGTDAQLRVTVRALMEGGATPSSDTSKLARALPLPKVRQRTGRSAGVALLDSMARHRDRLITTDRALRESAQESVHDARAVARRIRSVLRVFEALFAQQPALSLREKLQQFGEVLSVARDVEVVGDRLRSGLADEPDESARTAAMLIAGELDRRTSVAAVDVGAYLDSAEYLAMLRDLDEFVAHPPLTRRAARSAKDELPLQLGRSWRQLRAKAAVALGDTAIPDAVHDVRKAAKTMRYAAEATIAVLGDQAVLFAAALEEIQEDLGEFQDASITARLLHELAADPHTDGVTGFTLGRLHAVETALAAGAVDDFADAWDRVEDADLVSALGRD